MPRNILIFFIAVGLILGATSAMAEQIKTKKQFLGQVAGKKLVESDSWVVLSPDGTVSGQGPGNGKITGRWDWIDSYYCREITIDGEGFPRDCQTVTRDGKTVNFIHEMGKGITISWTIE
ncbi:MAG: hypothetical protein AAF942_01490 [Pseudomonadota bacterium]